MNRSYSPMTNHTSASQTSGLGFRMTGNTGPNHFPTRNTSASKLTPPDRSQSPETEPARSSRPQTGSPWGSIDLRACLTLLIEILPSPSLLRPPPADSLLGQIRRVFSLVVRCGRGPRDAPARSEFQSVVLRSAAKCDGQGQEERIAANKNRKGYRLVITSPNRRATSDLRIPNTVFDRGLSPLRALPGLMTSASDRPWRGSCRDRRGSGQWRCPRP
jgi:hypothetical protein